MNELELGERERGVESIEKRKRKLSRNDVKNAPHSSPRSR